LITFSYLLRDLDSITSNLAVHNILGEYQGGIFPGKTGRIFPGNIEISQEMLVENHALFYKNSFLSKEDISFIK
jgi:hypothetical protein